MKSSKYKINESNIKQTFNNAKKDCLVIGISGGIDSLVCLKMLITWFGKDKIKPYYLPIQSNKKISRDIDLISQELQVTIKIVDLTKLYKQTVKATAIKNEFNKFNLKPKLRAIYLAAQAFEYNGLVVSCLNYDEYYLGYFTKHGDSAGDIYPVLNFCKKEIYHLAKQLNLPLAIINKKPSADLYENQLDEQELKLTYEEIDNYLQFKKVSQQVVDRIKLLKKTNSHKHQLNNFLFATDLRKI